MTAQVLVSTTLALVGAGCVLVAIANERRMHRHRQPGVTYAQATFRRDGGWRRSDLFREPAFILQRRASTFGVAGMCCWIAGLLAWMLLRGR